MLMACGVQQQRLAGSVPAFGIALDQQLTDRLGAGRAARLASKLRRDPGALQGSDQGFGLSRFPGPLPAFQSDKFSAGGQR
jgi:hypothetical protein